MINFRKFSERIQDTEPIFSNSDDIKLMITKRRQLLDWIAEGYIITDSDETNS